MTKTNIAAGIIIALIVVGGTAFALGSHSSMTATDKMMGDDAMPHDASMTDTMPASDHMNDTMATGSAMMDDGMKTDADVMTR